MNINKNGTLLVRQTAYGEETEERIEVEVPVFPEGVVPGQVMVAGGLTKNLGNYNSARIEVAVTLPCLPSETEVKRVAELASGWVESIIQDKVGKVS